ncbi:MAG: S8 family serine peptidase [Gemmataceae bacterium]|nr:S8 family serine peptidase [Gemmataceae bacterium]MCI0741381.1 S8 family serine peptidase [Gemmataceae bacterium]
MPDVFDEIFALLDPERLLRDPRATGEGVRLAVIDSGVERAVLEEKFRQIGQAIVPVEGGIFVADRTEPLPYEGKQSTPHGTTVADIILTLAPRVQLFSADIFGPQGSCEVDVVIKALHWAIDVWHCKVINLSLGVTEQRLQQLPKRQQFLRAVEDGYYKDVLIFAAAHNDHPLTRSYPALFSPPLISVDKKLFADPLHFAYELCDQVEFQAHGRGYLGPFAQEPATSWAAPHLAGIAARLLSLRPQLKPFEMKTILYWLFQAQKK